MDVEIIGGVPLIVSVGLVTNKYRALWYLLYWVGCFNSFPTDKHHSNMTM